MRKVKVTGFKVQDARCRVQVAGCRAQGAGFIKYDSKQKT